LIESARKSVGGKKACSLAFRVQVPLVERGPVYIISRPSYVAILASEHQQSKMSRHAFMQRFIRSRAKCESCSGQGGAIAELSLRFTKRATDTRTHRVTSLLSLYSSRNPCVRSRSNTSSEKLRRLRLDPRRRACPSALMAGASSSLPAHSLASSGRIYNLPSLSLVEQSVSTSARGEVEHGNLLSTSAMNRER
jgi:hypothetical protein